MRLKELVAETTTLHEERLKKRRLVNARIKLLKAQTEILKKFKPLKLDLEDIKKEVTA